MAPLIFFPAATPADVVATYGNHGLFFTFHVTEQAIQNLHINLFISNLGFSLCKYKKLQLLWSARGNPLLCIPMNVNGI
jgi:hypothetical protein